MESREQRIAALAATLKNSGIAKSDSQAKMMAEDMVGVEEHVQKSYEVEHARANEHIQTSKHLGNPRIREPTPQESVRPIPIRSEPAYVEPIKSYATSPAPARSSNMSDVVTTSPSTSHEAPGVHDTHNSAIEAIKAQMQTQKIVSLEDKYAAIHLSNSESSDDFVDYTKLGAESKTLGSSVVQPVPVRSASVELDSVESTPVKVAPVEPTPVKPAHTEFVAHLNISKDIPEEAPAHHDSEGYVPIESLAKTTMSEAVVSDAAEASVKNAAVSVETADIPVETVDVPVVEVELPTSLNSSKVDSSSTQTSLSESNFVIPEKAEAPKLDAQRLVELMEEDGNKMEEHTREIKEKPKDVKPKEAYVENSIDLASVFSFNKK